MALRGERCRACLTTDLVQCAHVMPRSQGGPSVVENGTPLCMGCHADVDQYRARWSPAWLDPDQLVWLASVGWVDWDGAGEPFGRGCRRFGMGAVA
jgi:hypothetical protein